MGSPRGLLTCDLRTQLLKLSHLHRITLGGFHLSMRHLSHRGTAVLVRHFLQQPKGAPRGKLCTCVTTYSLFERFYCFKDQDKDGTLDKMDKIAQKLSELDLSEGCKGFFIFYCLAEQMAGCDSGLLAGPLIPALREIHFLLSVLLQMHGAWLGLG